MTPEQMETEIAGLRETVTTMQKAGEARQKNLRTYRYVAAFIALLYIAASIGCVIAGVLLNAASLTTLAPVIIIAAVPVILLANVVKALMVPELQRAGVQIESGSNVPPEVLEALQQGQTIKAIQLYRVKMGTGLKETQEFIEALQRRPGLT